MMHILLIKENNLKRPYRKYSFPKYSLTPFLMDKNSTTNDCGFHKQIPSLFDHSVFACRVDITSIYSGFEDRVSCHGIDIPGRYTDTY